MITLFFSLEALSFNDFESFCFSSIEPICSSYDSRNYDCEAFAKNTCNQIANQDFDGNTEMKKISEQLKYHFIEANQQPLMENKAFKISVLKHLLKNQ